MHPHPHRGNRRWRRFFRDNSSLVFVAFIVFFVLAAVAGLFYFISSGRFVNSP